MKTLYTDCDPTVADDRTLPTNAFLIEYLQDGMTKFDVVMSGKKSEIFDLASMGSKNTAVKIF